MPALERQLWAPRLAATQPVLLAQQGVPLPGRQAQLVPLPGQGQLVPLPAQQGLAVLLGQQVAPLPGQLGQLVPAQER